MNENLWVELNSDIVIARIRGVPTEPVLRECQERILMLLKDTGCRRVLYDALEQSGRRRGQGRDEGERPLRADER